MWFQHGGGGAQAIGYIEVEDYSEAPTSPSTGTWQ